MNTHTPQPWHVNGYAYKADDSAPTGRRVFACTADSDLCEGYLIASANATVAEIKSHRRLSDARLIAAAPDLLAALQRLVDCPALYLDDQEPEDIAAREQARAAIRKATGQG